MKILKELFRDKKLEAELKQELKETKEKYEFLKIEFTKLLKSENNLRTELEKNQEKFSKEIGILFKENTQKLKLVAEELEEKYYEEKKEQEIILKELNSLKESFKRLQVPAWTDFWGYDVDHDWPWWRIQFPYFLDIVL